MTPNEAIYFTLPLTYGTKVATLVLFGWLYRNTRLKPMLYYLCWYVVSLARELIVPNLHGLMTLGPGQVPRTNVYLFAASLLYNVLGTVLFFWVMIALARRVRAGSAGKTVSRGDSLLCPDPAE